MIHLDHIERRFGARLLFSGVSWLIPRGGRLGLVGPNGVGKTTLLRILAGTDVPDAGSVRKPADLRVGYLPQEVETLEDGSVLSVVMDGFAEARRLDAEISALEIRMASLEPGEELASATAAYGELRHRFEILGGDHMEARARTILSGLGVPQRRYLEPVRRLSGGWRMRAALARLLLGRPDLLLLDEPTNHLDLHAIAWLESFLDSYEGAFVVVSHDRYFLNRTVRGIVELDRRRLTSFVGNYDDYLAEQATRDAALKKTARQQSLEIARAERFIERFRYKASKAKQVQSRILALSKVERVEPSRASRRIRFGFPPAPRSGDVVARIEGLAKSFGETPVYEGFDLILRRGDRVGLVGPNGAGKSTLLKLLDGRESPDRGTVTLGHNVTAHYYAQHQLEALDPLRSVLEELESVAGGETRQRLRALLGCFLFSGEDVEKKVAVLSGGEKARLALARLLIRPSNLLLLDEPTNHLDLKSREVLEEAINEYEGTLVVISHDRYFLNRVATSIGNVGGGRVELYQGDYDAWLEARGSADAIEVSPAEAADSARDRMREARRQQAEKRNRLYRKRRAVEERLEPIEAEIQALEERVRELTRMQADPSVYSDPERARRVAREKGEAEGELEALYARWESVAGGIPEG